MPALSHFFGIAIYMYIRGEHNPPHFHALYGEYEAVADIRHRTLIRGNLPRRILAMVLEWTELHQAELMEDWNLCQVKQLPKPIAPLA